MNDALTSRVSDSLKQGEILSMKDRTELLEGFILAQKDYLKAREQYRHPKDKELTDFDRQTMLDAQTAEQRAKFELYKGLIELAGEQAICVEQ